MSIYLSNHLSIFLYHSHRGTLTKSLSLTYGHIDQVSFPLTHSHGPSSLSHINVLIVSLSLALAELEDGRKL